MSTHHDIALDSYWEKLQIGGVYGPVLVTVTTCRTCATAIVDEDLHGVGDVHRDGRVRKSPRVKESAPKQGKRRPRRRPIVKPPSPRLLTPPRDDDTATRRYVRVPGAEVDGPRVTPIYRDGGRLGADEQALLAVRGNRGPRDVAEDVELGPDHWTYWDRPTGKRTIWYHGVRIIRFNIRDREWTYPRGKLSTIPTQYHAEDLEHREAREPEPAPSGSARALRELARAEHEAQRVARTVVYRARALSPDRQAEIDRRDAAPDVVTRTWSSVLGREIVERRRVEREQFDSVASMVSAPSETEAGCTKHPWERTTGERGSGVWNRTLDHYIRLFDAEGRVTIALEDGDLDTAATWKTEADRIRHERVEVSETEAAWIRRAAPKRVLDQDGLSEKEREAARLHDLGWSYQKMAAERGGAWQTWQRAHHRAEKKLARSVA